MGEEGEVAMHISTMKKYLYNYEDSIKKASKYLGNLNASSAVESVLGDRLRLESTMRELAENTTMRFANDKYIDFEIINKLTINYTHEFFLKELQMTERIKQAWSKYVEVAASYRSMAETVDLKVKQFNSDFFNVYKAGSEYFASIAKAAEAIRANFSAISDAQKLNDHLNSIVLRPSIELHSFIEKSDNLFKKRLKDSLLIDTTNRSIELAASESVESTNLILSTSDVFISNEEDLVDISVTIPTFNLYYFQRKDILFLAQQNPNGFQKTENIDNLPSYSYYKIAITCCHLITKCNQKCGASGKEFIFKPTNKLMAALTVIPNLITSNESIFGEFIDNLFILLYEGAGDDKLRLRDYLSDNELQPLWNIKQLRNFYLRHDIEHSNSKEAKHKMQKIGDIFYSLIAKPLPENGHDYRKAQTEIINNVLAMLNSLFKKINNSCN